MDPTQAARLEHLMRDAETRRARFHALAERAERLFLEAERRMLRFSPQPSTDL